MNYKKIIYESASWSDLDKKLSKLTHNNKTEEAGAIFAIVVKLFLQTNPIYKTKISKIWLEKEVPIKIRNKINFPGTDEGIDLIAETKEKKIWSIQAKYRSNPNEMLRFTGKKSLSTFTSLSFFTCNNISHGLVCATINKPPKKIHLLPTKKNKSVGFILRDVWDSLDNNKKEEWNIIRNKAKGLIIKPTKKEEKDFQLKAINKTASYFKKKNRGKLIMPCGTGKSLMSFWIAKKMNAKKIIIAVPSLALISQTLKVWTTEYTLHNIYPEWLCVCSDETVSKDQDEFISSTHDLGIETTTDQDEIRKFLNNNNGKIKIIFTTYQSGKVLSLGAKKIKFNLAIFDEAHKTVGNEDKLMGYLLKEKSINVDHRLFMTATERLYHTKNKKVFSMDNAKIYGEEIHSMSFKEAIEDKEKIICDYKIITLTISQSQIEDLVTSNKFIELKKMNKDVSAREFASLLALRKEITNLNLKKVITFHSKKERAKDFSDEQKFINKNYNNLKKMDSFHVRGDMPVSKRNIQMKGFEENDSIITNARCLTEGVDVPAVDCVAFIDPKKSTVDIVQAAGRTMRKSHKKKFGYIFVPLIIPKNESLDKLKEDSSFKEIVSIISSLASSDSRIVDHLKSISSGKTYRGGSPIDGLVKKKLFKKIDAKIFEDSIKTEIWKRIRNRVTPDLDKKDILKWIIEHKKITKNYPNQSSGEVKTAIGEKWELIQACLNQGRRGLPGGESISKLIYENLRKGDFKDNDVFMTTTDIFRKYGITAMHNYRKKGYIKAKGEMISAQGSPTEAYDKNDIIPMLKKAEIDLFFIGSKQKNLKELGIKLVDRKKYYTQFEAMEKTKKTFWLYVNNRDIELKGKGFTEGGVSKFFLKKDVNRIVEKEKKEAKLIKPETIKKKYKINAIIQHVRKKKIKPDGFYMLGKKKIYLFDEDKIKKYKKSIMRDN